MGRQERVQAYWPSGQDKAERGCILEGGAVQLDNIGGSRGVALDRHRPEWGGRGVRASRQLLRRAYLTDRTSLVSLDYWLMYIQHLNTDWGYFSRQRSYFVIYVLYLLIIRQAREQGWCQSSDFLLTVFITFNIYAKKCQNHWTLITSHDLVGIHILNIRYTCMVQKPSHIWMLQYMS